jgi:uncharacterized protein YbjQ (UPF0145 family)
MSRSTIRKEPVLRGMVSEARPSDLGLRGAEPLVRDITVTTTSNLEGREVSAYIGIVAAEVVLGTELIQEPSRGIMARFRRSPASVGSSLTEARDAALREMKSRAAAKGADAVIGVSLGHQVVNSMLLVTATGTAVRLSQ